jgi:hypothetical protein
MKEAQQLKLFGNTSLGVLPKSLMTPREIFILALWEQMREDGSTLSQESIKDTYGNWKKIYNNTIPNGYDIDSFLSYLNKSFVTVDFKIDNRHPKFTRYQAYFGKFGITFEPQSVVQMAFDIIGKDALTEFSPKLDNPYELTPNNKVLMGLMSDFIRTDDIRPALTKVFFDDDGVVATTGNSILKIYGKTTKNGLFDAKTYKINHEYQFPKYKNILPQKQDFSVELDCSQFIKTIEQVVSIIKNNAIKQVLCTIENDTFTVQYDDPDYNNNTKLQIPCTSVSPKIDFMLNCKILKPFFKNILLKTKPKFIQLDFSAPNKAFTINTQSRFGNCLFLFMPMIPPINSIADFEERKSKFSIKSRPETNNNTKALLLLKLKLQTQTLELLLKI